MANSPYSPQPTDLVAVIPVLGDGSQSPEIQLSQVQNLGSGGGGGTVTSIVAGTGINVGAGPGGTITATGTLNARAATTGALGSVVVGTGIVVNAGTISTGGSGATGARPTSNFTGQFFFDTSLGTPIWWSGSAWVNSAGIPV